MIARGKRMYLPIAYIARIMAAAISGDSAGVQISGII